MSGSTGKKKGSSSESKWASRKFGLAGVVVASAFAAQEPWIAVAALGIYTLGNVVEGFHD